MATQTQPTEQTQATGKTPSSRPCPNCADTLTGLRRPVLPARRGDRGLRHLRRLRRRDGPFMKMSTELPSGVARS